MYHLNTFCLPKNKVVNKWVGKWHIQRNIKKCHENNNTSTLTSLNNTSQNVMNVEIFFNVILNNLTSMVIRWERGKVSAAHVGGGGWGQAPTS